MSISIRFVADVADWLSQRFSPATRSIDATSRRAAPSRGGTRPLGRTMGLTSPIEQNLDATSGTAVPLTVQYATVPPVRVSGNRN